ncbi:MAG TPA: HD domain-containing protein [Chloroflexota bacterium]|jgi:HD superfamily phosphodiesterase|nr:HD domain-containing protein [Chloroflexota bacterium]
MTIQEVALGAPGAESAPLTEHEPFHRDVADLLGLPELHSSRQRVHHFDLSEFDHLMLVAKHAHRLSRYVKADARICARAGLLHDLGAHWFNTLAPCALAQRLEEPVAVHHAIRAHTILPVLPRTREAWVVVAADFLTSAQECHFVFRRVRARAGARLRERLGRPARLLSPIWTIRAGRARRVVRAS